jgi:catechol 2,3-dioxygenase-like lactoylglutathione lyase family enzyme
MSLRWYTVVIDCRDVAAQADWWAGVLGWQKVYEAVDEVVIVPPPPATPSLAGGPPLHALTKGDQIPVEEQGPGLVFVPVPEGKSVKNRLHLDLAPHADDDQSAEVERLIGLGATRIDVGQPVDATFVVLADPEGNEFCVLSARD